MNLTIFLLILLFSLSVFFLGKTKATNISKERVKLHSLPSYYGYYIALWCGVPALIIFSLWSLFEPMIIKLLVINNLPNQDPDKLNLIYERILAFTNGTFTGEINDTIQSGSKQYQSLRDIFEGSKIALVSVVILLCSIFAYQKISAKTKARDNVEKILRGLLFTSSLIAILTTIGIILSLLFESIKFFSVINIVDFLFGTGWSPQRAFVRDASAITAEELAEITDAFGSVPLFAGTAFIALIAMLVAAPIGLFSGIFMAEYASVRVRKFTKPIIEILAGIPTVVYGFFAALTVGPFFREFGSNLGLDVSSESALAAGLVMGIMIIPYVSSLSDDVINAVPQSLREGSYAVGATKSETIKKVVVPAALPGIIGSLLLAISRAIGETMIVVMAAGLAANLTINPLESTTTITTQIVMILIGDQEFDSPKTQSAFALGLTLFFATLVLNYIALRVVKKYREKYD
jgi:phosphate transport system permease protein